MLIIYTIHITNRFQYAVDTLFEHITNVPFQLTADINFYQQSDAVVKINYSSARILENELWIQPHALLFENSVHPQTIECFEWQHLKVFFKTGGNIPFDIFAASFYLVTRYEEYLPHTLDKYGRYAHTNSLAFNEGFLGIPLVNLWVQELLKLLQRKFPLFAIYHSPFAFLPTYDIDIAYAYKGKGLLRNAGGFFKDLFSLKVKEAAKRVLVLSALKHDPFDVYDWLDSLHLKYGLRPIYFYLLAGQNHRYDKNTSPQSDEIKQLIVHHTGKNYYSGIHPSWQSGDNIFKLKKEIETLKNLVKEDVWLSRQHYIRLTFPKTFRILIELGIEHEYSMGYGSINGFRGSVSSSFYWYDLEKDEQTELMIHPFCYMEANSFFEQRYTPQQAAEELQQYYNVVKSVNGQLITIFHNHFVTEQKVWIGWRNMYEAFLKKNFS